MSKFFSSIFDYLFQQDWGWLQSIDLISAVLGLLYLWLEYRANIWLWAVSVIMPAVHAYLYYEKGLYADFGMEFYYIAMAIYGYACWRWGNKKDKDKEFPITHYKHWHILASTATWLVLWGLIYWILITFTDSRVPILDSFTTSLWHYGLLLRNMLSNGLFGSLLMPCAVDYIYTKAFLSPHASTAYTP